jgi:PAS domain-containing protein
VKPFSARELVAQVRAQLTTARARKAFARKREVLLASERSARLDAERQWDDLVQLFEQAPNPMLILRGTDHVIELVNPAACETWGRRART